MALFGSLATVRTQVAPADKFASALAYLDEVFRAGSPAAERIRDVAVGETRRIELGGGAFALEQAYRTKPRAEGFFESHRKYIDVQVVVEGTERLEVADIARSAVSEAYLEERDFIKYADVAGASVLSLQTGEAAVFFPADVHMPCLVTAAGATVVRKTVIKVPVAPMSDARG